MALFNCKECGTSMSDLAAACPSCGCPTHLARPGATSAPASSPPPPPPPPPASPQPRIDDRMSPGVRAFKWGFFLGVPLLVYGCVHFLGSDDTPRVPYATTPITPLTPAQQAENERLQKEQAFQSLVTRFANKQSPATHRLAAAVSLISDFPDSAEASGAKKELAKLQAAATAEAQAAEDAKSNADWRYSTYPDQMTGKDVKQATVTSDNILLFEFPYGGAQHGTLTLRKHPKWGKDVIVAIEKGQILCHTYSDCTVGVRFDDGPVITYTGTPPEDNSTEMVFLPAYGKFVDRLATAKQVKIQFSVYQQGNVVLSFNVKGFKQREMK